MIVYDADGKEYLIEETDLKGGESKLYTVEKHPELRAKIFKEEYRTRGREAKILEWENMIERNELNTINEQIQNIAQKKDTLCRRMYN